MASGFTVVSLTGGDQKSLSETELYRLQECLPARELGDIDIALINADVRSKLPRGVIEVSQLPFRQERVRLDKALPLFPIQEVGIVTINNKQIPVLLPPDMLLPKLDRTGIEWRKNYLPKDVQRRKRNIQDGVGLLQAAKVLAEILGFDLVERLSKTYFSSNSPLVLPVDDEEFPKQLKELYFQIAATHPLYERVLELELLPGKELEVLLALRKAENPEEALKIIRNNLQEVNKKAPKFNAHNYDVAAEIVMNNQSLLEQLAGLGPHLLITNSKIPKSEEELRQAILNRDRNTIKQALANYLEVFRKAIREAEKLGGFEIKYVPTPSSWLKETFLWSHTMS